MTLRPDQLTESARRLYDDYRRSGLSEPAAVQAACEGYATRTPAPAPAALTPRAAVDAAIARAFGHDTGEQAKGPVSEADLEQALDAAFGRTALGG